MSYCRKEGKDVIIFATKEDHAIPSTVTLPEPEKPVGLITETGDINWNCPCLGGMATGPCGIEFREAFSCFHYSKEDPKGSDCLGAFKSMQDCMTQYPSLYSSSSEGLDYPNEDDELDNINEEEDEKDLSLTSDRSIAKDEKKNNL